MAQDLMGSRGSGKKGSRELKGSPVGRGTSSKMKVMPKRKMKSKR